MKAIQLDNGEIKAYSQLKSYNGKIGLQYANDDYLEALGFYNVITPDLTTSQTLGSIEWDSENNVFTYPVLTVDFDETLDELKEKTIKEVKAFYKNKLSETDWVIIRDSELGNTTEQSILDERAQLRADCSLHETNINSLSTKAEVVDYTY